MDNLLHDAPIDLGLMSDIFDTNLEIIAFLRDESLPVLNDLMVHLSHAIAHKEDIHSAKIAHKIRGGAASIGATEIATAMNMIEEKVKILEWDSVEAWLVVAITSIDHINAWVTEQS